jgi:hypothetical protein
MDGSSASHRLYHLSPYELNDISGRIELVPRIPRTRLPGEDGHTPRVCFSKSINGCLNSISHDTLFYGKSAWPYFVYAPVSYSASAYTPSEQLYNKIPDAYITDEIWITEPVEVRLIGVIRALKRFVQTGGSAAPGPGRTYRYIIAVLAGNLADCLDVSLIDHFRCTQKEALVNTVIELVLKDTRHRLQAYNAIHLAGVWSHRFINSNPYLIPAKIAGSLVADVKQHLEKTLTPQKDDWIQWTDIAGLIYTPDS